MFMSKFKESDKHEGMISFYCPACKETHCIGIAKNNCGFPIWGYNGDNDNPTVTPSIKVEYHGADKDTICHSFIKDGKIEYLQDCTHELAGKTVELPEFKDD